MKVFRISPDNPEPELIEQAAEAVRSGGIAIIPTDTVYGVAASPHAPDAMDALFRLKQRPADKPLPLLIDHIDRAADLGAALTPAAKALAAQFWPGPLTMVLPAGKQSEGLRIPDHPVTLALLRACGGALRTTSANRSGDPEALTADEAIAALAPGVDVVVDCGPSPGGEASSVITLTDEKLEVLREGAIPRNSLENVLRENSL